MLDAELDVLVGLLLRLGDVHHADEAPLVAIGDGAELGGSFLHHVPVQAEQIEALGLGCTDRQQADAVAAGETWARR